MSTPMTAPERPFVFPGTESVDPAEVFAGPGYTSPKGVENGLASAALWLTVVGLFIPFLLVVSEVLAVIAYVKSRGLYGHVGARESMGAMVVGGIAMILWITAIVLLMIL